MIKKFDGNKGIIDFFYFGYFFEKDYSVRGMVNLGFDDRTSYVNLPNKQGNTGKFSSPQNTSFNSGTGYFLDSSAAGTEQTKFHFIRVTDDLIKIVLDSKTIDELDAERCFVINFHKKFGDEFIRNDYLSLGAC